MDKGAHFYRCDFQVHTPRDRRWTSVTPTSDEDRRAYADRLVAACRAEGVAAIAVTDHHDMTFVPFIRRAAAEEVDEAGNLLPEAHRLVVFPGMELTLGVPCQALLVFDADFPDDMHALAMTALAITPANPGDSKNAEVVRLDKINSLVALKEKLDEHSYLKDRYIILPHVGNSGDFSLLRKGMAGKYSEMPCVGGYIDGAIDKLDGGNRNILSGQDKQWGNKRIACIQTSDTRRDDHSELGNPSTWIKWAEPTAEGLRQACLAQESRIAHTPPQVPQTYIANVSVSTSTFLGPADLALNPQYSALIGGRGSGKSTMLEYIRWALCDQPPAGDEVDTPNYQLRRSRLIDATLKQFSATVDVRYVLNGVLHLVRRASSDGSVQLSIGGGELRSCSEEEVRSLLPIQAYSQKQLSDVSVRLDELNRFITAPVQIALNRLERGAIDRSNRIRQAYATVQRHRELLRLLENRALEERSIAQQVEAIRATLGGLSSEDQALLAQGSQYTAADRAMEAWCAGAETLRAKAAELASLIAAQRNSAAAAPQEPIAHQELLAQAHAKYVQLLDEAGGLVETVARSAGFVADAASELDGPWVVWGRARDSFRSRYTEATERSSAHRERLSEMARLEEQLGHLSQELARGHEQLATLQSAEQTYRDERAAWIESLAERDDLIDRECALLTERASAAIRVRMRRFADGSGFLGVLRGALQGSRILSAKLEQLTGSITAAKDPRAHWLNILDELERLSLFDAERDLATERPLTPTLLASGLSAGDIQRVADSLQPDEWLTLSLTPIASVPIYEYQSGEGIHIPFENASAGQQATALLKTLLNSPGPPLIVDQPEEDLDNPVMLEIVKQLWLAKGMRQIIFASHNANLVVNGDAELVAWFGYRNEGDQSRGTIMGVGAIDVTEVRDAIKAIMEGGEAAFRLRREKYGF